MVVLALKTNSRMHDGDMTSMTIPFLFAYCVLSREGSSYVSNVLDECTNYMISFKRIPYNHHTSLLN